MIKLNRREAIKAVSCLVGAPLLASEALSKETGAQKKWDIVCDSLIVGGGAAGTFAAISCKEYVGGKVLLVDKNPSLFLNSTSYSAGGANAAGTKAQQLAGINDLGGPDEFENDILVAGNHVNDEALVSLYAHNVAGTLDWLVDHGVGFRPSPNPAFKVPRMHMCNGNTGAQYVQTLYNYGKSIGVEYLLSTKVTELIQDPTSKRVIGVVAENKGKVLRIRAEKAVVLACGGFAGDVKMIDKYLLDFKGSYTCASPASTGDGLKMASMLGAATTHLPYGAMYAYGVPTNPSQRRGMIYRGHVMNLTGSITVGPDGKRFVPDEVAQTEVSIAMARKKYKDVYIIATQKQLDEFLKDPIQVIGWDRKKFLDEVRDEKLFIKKADTIEELAKKMKLPVETLVETIKQYNQYAKSGKDIEFNRKSLKEPLEKGPFYGFSLKPVAIATIGGLKVNGHLQVLDVYDKPIKGLFAVGEVVGGLNGSSYIGGNSVGAALTFGKIVGEMISKTNS